ncbi:hypothetical protein HHL22_07745 [Hymenobacter sp. RP-2-7]|uniref:SRPBCC family protein n=1 Tax=Hymenobacter polaris TaxID=2682546 RepID=A0A7Y0FLR8_9BACT|nr:hypothetical protein [Hymenobacter polaris]NML65097.1 hypothetical protein [Hymenobacter polaris]
MCQSISPFTITKTINIGCTVVKAVDCMSDAPQWLPWALPQVESVQPLPFGQWLVKTPAGLAKLRPCYDATHGAAQYELLTANTTFRQVPVQLLATPSGCHLAITLTKPEQLNYEAFEASVQRATQELHILKLMLEQD